MSEKPNGSVDRLAEALRDVITEAVDESVDRKLEPVKEDVAELKEDGRTNRILLRAMARHMLPKEVLAELGEEAAP